jgi:probable rRNA maturation factor
MVIKIVNDQKKLKINKKLIEKQIKEVLNTEKVKTDEVIIHFVHKKAIKKLHKQFFNDSSITDCITFPIDTPTDKKTFYHILGEAFICTDVACQNAKTYKTSVLYELTLYVIHTILHLIGYNDIKEKDIKVMRKKEMHYLTLLKNKDILK